MNKKWFVGIFMVLCLMGVAFCFYSSKDAVDLNLSVNVFNKTGDLIYDKSYTTENVKLEDALYELTDLSIEIEDGPYGAYINSINGIEQGDNYYWMYYVNGEYASVGISSYELNDNDNISFKIEKFEE